jgi:hypothetical protein
LAVTLPRVTDRPSPIGGQVLLIRFSLLFQLLSFLGTEPLPGARREHPARPAHLMNLLSTGG